MLFCNNLLQNIMDAKIVAGYTANDPHDAVSIAKALYDGDGTATVLKVSTSEVEISGNLTIAGTLTNVNTTNLQVDDSLIQLGRDNNSSDVVDIGFVGLYDAGGTDKYAGLFRDANDSGKFKLFIDSLISFRALSSL